jgi:hypothetical protein
MNNCVEKLYWQTIKLPHKPKKHSLGVGLLLQAGNHNDRDFCLNSFRY